MTSVTRIDDRDIEDDNEFLTLSKLFNNFVHLLTIQTVKSLNEFYSTFEYIWVGNKNGHYFFFPIKNFICF